MPRIEAPDSRPIRAVVAAPYPLPIVITRPTPPIRPSSITGPLDESLLRETLTNQLNQIQSNNVYMLGGFPYNPNWRNQPPAIQPIPYPPPTAEDLRERQERRIRVKLKLRQQQHGAGDLMSGIEEGPTLEAGTMKQAALGAGVPTNPTSGQVVNDGNDGLLNTMMETNIGRTFFTTSPKSNFPPRTDPAVFNHHGPSTDITMATLTTPTTAATFATTTTGQLAPALPVYEGGIDLRRRLPWETSSIGDSTRADDDFDHSPLSHRLITPAGAARSVRPVSFYGQSNLFPFTYHGSGNQGTASQSSASLGEGYESDARSIRTITRIPRGRHTRRKAAEVHLANAQTQQHNDGTLHHEFLFQSDSHLTGANQSGQTTQEHGIAGEVPFRPEQDGQTNDFFQAALDGSTAAHPGHNPWTGYGPLYSPVPMVIDPKTGDILGMDPSWPNHSHSGDHSGDCGGAAQFTQEEMNSLQALIAGGTLTPFIAPNQLNGVENTPRASHPQLFQTTGFNHQGPSNGAQNSWPETIDPTSLKVSEGSYHQFPQPEYSLDASGELQGGPPIIDFSSVQPNTLLSSQTVQSLDHRAPSRPGPVSNVASRIIEFMFPHSAPPLVSPVPPTTRGLRLPSAPDARQNPIPVAKACHNYLLARKVYSAKKKRMVREHEQRVVERERREGSAVTMARNGVNTLEHPHGGQAQYMNPTTTAQNPVDNHVWPRLDAGSLWTHPSPQVYHPDPLTSPRERKRRRGRSPTPIPLPGARLDLHLSPSLVNTASHNANSTRSTIASRTDRPRTEGRRREAGGKGKGKRTSEDSFDEDQVGHNGKRASSEGGSESTVTEKPRQGLQAHLGGILGHGLGMDRGLEMVQLPDLPIHPPQQIDQLNTSNRHIEPLQFFTNPLIPIGQPNILSHGDNPPSFALPGISTYQGVMPVQSIWPTTTHAPAPTAPTYPIAPLRNMFDRAIPSQGHNDGLSIFNVLMRQSEGLGRELSVDEKRRRNAMWIEADRQRAMTSTTLQPPTNRWQAGQPDSRDLSPFREAAAEAHEVESIAPSIYGIKRESRGAGAGGREAWLKDMHKLIQEEVGLALKDVTGKLLQQRQGKKRR